MGYYADTMIVRFAIKRGNLDGAYEALCALKDSDSCPFPVEEDYDDVFDIFEDVGFKTYENIRGDLGILSFCGEFSPEDEFFAALAPFVEDGSLIEWQGGDSKMWCHLFKDGSVKTLSVARIIWADEDGNEFSV